MKEEKIKKALTRGVEAIYPSPEALEGALKSGKVLKIYNGIDPTGKLHIGHGIILRKLKEFQDLGHKIIILIGDFTAQIGDPTDKMAARIPLTHKQALKNAKKYKKQIGKILDLKKTEFVYNSKWLSNLNLTQVLKLASYFTAQQTLARDMFQERIRAGKDLYLHEFLYPLMQSYDSVVLDVDLEIGGNDQMFNMLCGRTLMKRLRNKEKLVLTTKLLVDSTGKKMGKTEGNVINLDDKPQEMYGKIMSWPDEMIIDGLEICTDIPMSQIKEMERKLKKEAVNPRDLKMLLAREIVTQYHSQDKAQRAEENFKKIFQRHETPQNLPEYKVKNKKYTAVELLIESKLVKSKGEARRVIEQKGVSIDKKIVKDINLEITIPKEGVIIQKGKRHFIKIKGFV
ncbi:MAG: tyrosine--tRNA ligase [Parcubacteria group bacterium CG23_combo_of_CG06-09_8_20_14_all_35_9]|nr:MAG: tyrosine--tRNA ligase [Parcubacteria group bacterium CG23_combo_of_CG06-09_8_20_14_all_35_9]